MAKTNNLKKIGKKKGATPTSNTSQLEEELVNCMSCDRKLKRSQFYKSFNPNHKSNIVPFCKECWFRLSSNPLGEVDRERFKEVLRMNDRPYIHELFINSYREHKTPTGLVGNYMKRIALHQFKDMSWVTKLLQQI